VTADRSRAGSGSEPGAAPDPAESAVRSGESGSTARQPHDATIGYPGGLRARWRWAGSGQGSAVFALSEAGGSLEDLGPLVSPSFEELCRAELRIDGPGGTWTVRLASPISDDPAALVWDDEGLLVVKYGFMTYAFEGRTGTLRWSHRSASPLIAVLGSPRLPHVLVQSEIETFAIEADGTVGWRIAHSDVVAEAALLGGRLVLTSYGGQATAIDPRSGRVAPGP
jgi:outer membrane protein assembly factor BamB